METLIEYRHMREAIQRLRELHKKDKYGTCDVCAVAYPCLTIRTLDNDVR